MDFEFLSILAFFGIIATLIIKDRKNIEFGLILIRRTQKGKTRIKYFAEKHKKFFNKFANISLVIAVILSLLGSVYLLKGVGVRLILPKVFPGEVSEGVGKVAFFMPLWYWVIGLFVIIVPHELFHGFLFALEKIKIKSTGFLLFLIFPGGFVEPDEKQFRESNPKTRMRVAAVGSIANVCIFITLILIIFLWNYLGSTIFEETGVIFESTMPNTPADELGMKGVIIEVDGKEVKNLVDLSNSFNDIKPNDDVNITTTEGEYNLKTIENPENSSQPFIGIKNLSTKLDYKSNFSSLGDSSKIVSIYLWFAGLFAWISLIDISVAVANLLPFLPFDGGVMWQAIIEKTTKKKKLAKRIIKVFSVITYCLLLFNLFSGLF